MTTQVRKNEKEKKPSSQQNNALLAKRQGHKTDRPEQMHEQSDPRPEDHSLLQLQRTHGNQVVQQLVNDRIQPKLEVGRPNDKYEREADQVAETVMRTPDHSVVRNTESHRSGGEIQSMCSRCRRRFLQGKSLSCTDCEEKLQRAESKSEISSSEDGPAREIGSLRGGGRPLSRSVRSFFEPRFGYDFSGVRIHSGERAAALNSDLNARAFTYGRDIYFGASMYSPHTTAGRRLLAHELAHVVQQNRSGTAHVTPDIQRKVERCCRNVQTGTSWIDTMSAALGLQHCWIKTDTKEAGMGPAEEGPLPANPLGVDTEITDHSNETGGECETIQTVDEACVNEQLQIGKSTGSWWPWNNCNTFAREVLSKCSTVRPQGPRYLGGGAYMNERGIIYQGPGPKM